jgi:Rad3-related DNA helicase
MGLCVEVSVCVRAWVCVCMCMCTCVCVWAWVRLKTARVTKQEAITLGGTLGIREAMGVDLRGHVVILDEAHNMEDAAREAGSCEATDNALFGPRPPPHCSHAHTQTERT